MRCTVCNYGQASWWDDVFLCACDPKLLELLVQRIDAGLVTSCVTERGTEYRTAQRVSGTHPRVSAVSPNIQKKREQLLAVPLSGGVARLSSEREDK